MDNIALELRELLIELRTIEHDNTVSLESSDKSFYILSPINKISGFFDNVNTKLHDLLHSEKFDQLDKVKDINKVVSKYIDKNKYIDVKDLTVPVLTGLNIELLRGLDYIYKEAKSIDPSIYNNVRETDTLLDLALTDIDFMKSYTPYKTNIEKDYKDIKRVENTIHHIVDKNSVIDRVPISKLLGNLNTFKDVTKLAVKIGDYLNTKNLKVLNKEVDALYTKIEYLKSDVLNKNNDINKDKLKTIINSIEVTAKYITVFTMLVYTYTKILNTIEHIANVLNNSKLQLIGKPDHDTTY